MHSTRTEVSWGLHPQFMCLPAGMHFFQCSACAVSPLLLSASSSCLKLVDNPLYRPTGHGAVYSWTHGSGLSDDDRNPAYEHAHTASLQSDRDRYRVIALTKVLILIAIDAYATGCLCGGVKNLKYRLFLFVHPHHHEARASVTTGCKSCLYLVQISIY